MRWLLALLLGAGLGLAAGAADTAATTDPDIFMRALDVVTDTVAVWALVAVIGGWLVARQPWSAFGGTLALASGLAAWSLWMAGKTDASLNLDLFGTETRAWIVGGLVVGPMLGLLGSVSRSNSAFGLCARISAPLALVAEMLWRHQASEQGLSVDPVVAWTAILMVIAGVLMTAIAVVGQQRSSTD